MDDNGSPWRWWHSVTLGVITGVAIWIALWRPWGLYTSWIVFMIALLAFILVAGYGISGAWTGAFIDERNMMSLIPSLLSAQDARSASG